MRTISALALAVILAFVLPSAALAGSWPSYGKDASNSRNGGTDGPSPSQAATLAPAWKFTAPSSDGDFTGTPVVAGGTVVAGASHGTVFALDEKTGAVRWSRNLNPSNDSNVTINGSAAISGGQVFVPVAQIDRPRLVALSLSDGSVMWDSVLDTQKDGDVFGSPQVSGSSVYIGTSALFGELNDPNVHVRGSVVALDTATGARKWKTFTVPPGDDGGAVWSTAAIDTQLGRLYVGTGNAYHAPAAPNTDSMLALRPSDGRIVEHFQATPDDVWNATTNVAKGPDADFGASPNLILGPDGRELLGEGQKSGTYWALDRRTFKPVWHTFVGPGTQAGGILGSTAYDGERIYGPNTPAGEIFALSRGGDIDWVSSDVDPIHFSPVSVANGVAYSTSMSGILTARDASSGVALAKIPLGWGSFGGVAITDGTVFADTGTTGGPTGSGIGQVFAFRPVGGSSSPQAPSGTAQTAPVP